MRIGAWGIMVEMSSILTKSQINEYLKTRAIIVEPLLDKENQICSTHIDLRLSNYFAKFKTFEKPSIDPAEELKNIEFIEKEYFHESFVIHPGEFVLGLTFEYIVIPNNIVGRLDGKSSVGRRGVVVHATAGHVDPGWKGHLVFELANLGEMPVQLYPLTTIATITFYQTKETEEYTGQYLGQTKIQTPKPDKLAEKLTNVHNTYLSELKKKFNES